VDKVTGALIIRLPVDGSMKKKTGLKGFPERIYTYDEVQLARGLIKRGHKHRLRIMGNPAFKEKTNKALKLVRTAGQYDFLRKYIRTIREIEGLSQLREAEASIWANKHAVEDKVEAACFFVQKAWQMRDYIEGKTYYGHIGETRAAEARKKFLLKLEKKAKAPDIKEDCRKKIELWGESKYL